MVAADLQDGIDANAVVLNALGAGLLINATGPHTLRFLPPLTLGEGDLEDAVDMISDALDCVYGE